MFWKAQHNLFYTKQPKSWVSNLLLWILHQVIDAAGMIIAKSMKLEVESRILTEQDLLDWLAQTLPIGKSLFKSRAKQQSNVDMTQSITDDALDMKFGRELHSWVFFAGLQPHVLAWWYLRVWFQLCAPVWSMVLAVILSK